MRLSSSKSPLLLLFLFLWTSPTLASAGEEEEGTKASKKEDSAPPSFFLQDSTDGLCLAGSTFKRCSIDTLFYVVGSPGEYHIHKRPRTSSDSSDATPDSADSANKEEEELCLARTTCTEPPESKEELAETQEVALAQCTHCGAKGWNILGDGTQGYVLSAFEGRICIFREAKTNKVFAKDCASLKEGTFTALQLHFVSKTDIQTMSSPSALFIAAAAANDISTLQSMLHSGTDVNARDWDQLTALIPACQNNHLEVVKLLVEAGVDVNGSDKDQITGLMEAAIKGHVEIVEYLVQKGVEVDAKAQSGVTALWLAASEGQSAVVQLLLEAGADANNVRVDGVKALTIAAVGGHGATCKALLQAGAEVHYMDKNDGLTVLMNAAESGSLETLQAIREAMATTPEPELSCADGEEDCELTDRGAGLDRYSKTGYTALIIASAHNHLEAVKYLLAEGAQVDATSENGVTALMYAAAGGHTEVMKVLIEEGKADVNKKHTHEGGAILEACAGGSKEAIQLLIEKGADHMMLDKDGVSALMSASSQGHYDIVEFLLQTMKDSDAMSDEAFEKFVNLPSHSGGTAVMFSAASGATNVTKLLIDHGADVTPQAYATPEYLESLAKAIADGTINEEEMDPHVDGLTGLHVAAQGGHMECVKLLLDNGAKVSLLDEEERTPLLLAVKGNHGEIATLLIEHGADPNTVYVDDEGASHNLLMDAIIVENEEFASLLIEKGADLFYVDETGVSTLLQASHRGLDKIVKSLLEKYTAMGPSGEEGSVSANYLDFSSDEGISPLIAAASEGHLPVLTQLIAAKGDVNAKDKDGTTALMAASARGHVEAVTALLDGGANVNEQNGDGHTALMFAYNGKNQVETLWERYAQFVEDGSEAEEKVDDKGTGPVIKEALENHTKLVNTLIARGADTKLKDKEGHTASDFDYHPDLDSEVMEKEALKEKIRDESKNEL